MPGGPVEPLSPATERKIRQRMPTLSIDRLNRLVSEYRIYRHDRERREPTPKKTLNELDELHSQASALNVSIIMMSEEAGDLLSGPGYKLGRPHIDQRLRGELELFMSAIRLASNDAPRPKKGKLPKLEPSLIRNLAAALRDAGVDAGPESEELLWLVGVVFNDVRYNVENVQKAVAHALKPKRGN